VGTIPKVVSKDRHEGGFKVRGNAYLDTGGCKVAENERVAVGFWGEETRIIMKNE
jgi:hypothetical protein